MLKHLLQEFFPSGSSPDLLSRAHLSFEAIQSASLLFGCCKHFRAFVEVSIDKLTLVENVTTCFALQLSKHLFVCIKIS